MKISNITRNVVTLIALFTLSLTSAASEVTTSVKGDTTYISDIYVLPSSVNGIDEVDFVLMMKCTKGAAAPVFFFGEICFGTEEERYRYKCNAQGEEEKFGVYREGPYSLKRDATGRILMKWTDGTALDKTRTLLTEPERAFKVYPSTRESNYYWQCIRVAVYPLTSQEVERLATEGITRLRVSTFDGKYVTIDVDPAVAAQLFTTAFEQLKALQQGTEKPKGSYIHKQWDNLQNPLYKDF